MRILTQYRSPSSVWDLGGLTLVELARRVCGDIRQNDLVNRGYELAYHFLLAVFPLLLFLIALLGLFAPEGSKLQAHLLFYFQEALPPAAYGLIAGTLNEIAQNAGGGKMTFGLLSALYFGSGAMTQLMCTLNAAYEVRERRSWLKVHLLSIGMTIVMSILIIAALLFVFAGGRLLELLGRPIGWGAASVLAVGVLQWALALGFVVFCLAVVYYFAPDVKEPHWYWITPGSVIGVLLWAIASAVLRVYLHFFNVYSKTYGSLGAVIILMLWFYVSGLAFLVGGQINSTIEHAATDRAHQATTAGRQAA